MFSLFPFFQNTHRSLVELGNIPSPLCLVSALLSLGITDEWFSPLFSRVVSMLSGFTPFVVFAWQNLSVPSQTYFSFYFDVLFFGGFDVFSSGR